MCIAMMFAVHVVYAVMCINESFKDLWGSIMTIRKSVALINILIVIAIIVTGGMFALLEQKSKQVEAAYNKRFFSTLLVAELRGSSEELTRQVRAYAVTASEEAAMTYNNVIAVRNGQEPRPSTSLVAPGQRRVLLDLMKEYGITPQEFEKVQRATDLSNALIALEVESMNAVKGLFPDNSGAYTITKQPDRARAAELVFGAQYVAETRKIMVPLEEFQALVNKRTGEEVATLIAEQNVIAIVVSCALALVFMCSILSAWYLRRYVTTPLQETTDFAERVASGNLGSSIAVTTQNEMGTLRKTLNALVVNLHARFKEVEAASEEAKGKEQEALKMKAVADKALEASQQEEVLRLQLAERLQQVATVISSAASQLAEQVNNSEQGAIEQASHSTETATAMEEMNATVMHVSSNAQQAAEVADNARQKAQAGASIVTDVLNSMSSVQEQSETLRVDMQALGEHANSITQVMTVISDIADQTNLLALNAAIEAARAGEAGRGFAVVADEVRKLAEKTMSSTSDVRQAIQTIQASATESIQQVDKTVAVIEKTTGLAQESGTVLAEIVDFVASAATQIESISGASQEQAAASSQINRAISRISAISASTVEEMRSAAKAVSGLTAQVDEMTLLTAGLQKKNNTQ